MKQEPKNQFDEFLSNVHKGISLETTPEGKNLEKSTERIDAIESVELPVPKQMSIEPSEKPAKQTYDITLHVAQTLIALNPYMVFNFVSGAHTDSTEEGKLMWARVKGKTENALMQLSFKGEYNFRPGFMKPFKGQKNVKWFFRPIIWIFPHILPSQSLTLSEVGKAMINTVVKGYPKQVLEIQDIKELAK